MSVYGDTGATRAGMQSPAARVVPPRQPTVIYGKLERAARCLTVKVSAESADAVSRLLFTLNSDDRRLVPDPHNYRTTMVLTFRARLSSRRRRRRVA